MAINNDINIAVSVKDKTKKSLKWISKGFWGLKKTIEKNKQSFKNFWLAVWGATAAVWVIWKQFLDLATSVEATSKKAEVVFWEYTDWVREIAAETARAMWLSKNEYLNAAAWIQDLLIPMWFARDEATNMTTDLMWLSGALAEWSAWQYNASEVWDILAKAMLGEREQLKWLGIAISEADIQQRLLEKWMQDLTWVQLQQAKATATQELIFEKSTDAQKSYEEWSGSLTRQQAQLTATIKDAKDTLATALIPAFNELLKTLKPVIDSIAKSTEEWAANKDNITKVTEGIKWAITVFKTIAKIIWTITWFIFKMGEMFWTVAAAIAIAVWNINWSLDTFSDKAKAVTDYVKGLFDIMFWGIQKKIDWFKKAINALKRIVPGWSDWSSSESTSWARAVGWTVLAWKTYQVWERWPEFFTPSTTWTITPNWVWWGGIWPITISLGWIVVQKEADENRLISKMEDAFTRAIQLQKMGIS